MKTSPNNFITLFNRALSPAADSRVLVARYSAGFSPGPGRGSLTINFINLPAEHYKKRPSGSAEGENNRQMFMVWGFNEHIDSPVDKVKIEQSINSIRSPADWAPRLRAKTGDPETIAGYLAKYINKIAADFAPSYTDQ